MKVFIILSVVIIGALAVQGKGDPEPSVCFADVLSTCKTRSADVLSKCNAQYGGIGSVEGDLQDYINKQLVASYEYLKAATFFNSYNSDRPGFVKLFRSLSDKSFDDAIKLIKHITKRGGKADFNFHEEKSVDQANDEKPWESGEVYALGKALDKEKALAVKAIEIHKTSKNHHDPEIAQFLEEEFLEKQPEVIRKLSGYSNDLWKLLKTKGALPALSTYLFDEYLQKQ